eukprot:1431099-Amphidinium_carterae.1
MYRSASYQNLADVRVHSSNIDHKSWSLNRLRCWCVVVVVVVVVVVDVVVVVLQQMLQLETKMLEQKGPYLRMSFVLSHCYT